MDNGTTRCRDAMRQALAELDAFLGAEPPEYVTEADWDGHIARARRILADAITATE